MSKTDRRGFLRGVALAASSVLLGGSGGKAKIVVVGGGFAGMLLARLMAKHPKAQVTLVTSKPTFTTCPMGNAVIGGFAKMSQLKYTYPTNTAIRYVFAEASYFDARNKLLFLKDGSQLRWDKLVLASGISFAGNLAGKFLHGWQGGEQTALLARMVKELPNGGRVVIITPQTPYRCPPAPYERASLIAYHLKQLGNKRAKVLVLDSNPTYTKQKLFEEGWQRLYPNTIERVYIPEGYRELKGNSANGSVRVGSEVIKSELLNLIPPQRAADIATPLADGYGWCRINPNTLESVRAKDIHILGDAAAMGAMPKSAFAANSQAKALAMVLRAWLDNTAPPPLLFTNTCYSLLAPDYGISVNGSYRITASRIVAVSTATTGESPLARPPSFTQAEARNANLWYDSITTETWR